MQYTFTHNGKRYMYDLSSGEIFEYSRLEKELLPFMQRMEKPLPDICPSGLRYSLAKYEVSEIYDSYDRLLTLINTNKLIFTHPSERATDVKLNVTSADTETLIKAFSFAVNHIPTIEGLTVIPTGEAADAMAKELKERFSFIDVKTK